MLNRRGDNRSRWGGSLISSRALRHSCWASSHRPPSPSILLRMRPWATLYRRLKTPDTGMPQTSPRVQGTAAAFRNSLANESWLLLAAVVNCLHRAGSFVRELHPSLTILSTLPSAASRAYTLHLDLGVIALGIGIILLIGIVKKNAIMMIDFGAGGRGDPADEAIIQHACLHFRPIMMTTMAALFGALPLAMGQGYWFGTASAPRYLHRRRTDQSVAHALYNSRGTSGLMGWRAAFRRVQPVHGRLEAPQPGD